ncbi:MAG: glucose-6-phosphate dehydrogenase [Parachlamydia sp.]|nr:glucose-6-phosphate dehydrogenase [Parachlamydia sp.]
MKKITSIFLLFVFCFTSCHSVNHQQTKKAVEPHILVIFGATGDLAQRKLIPALYQLNLRGELPESFICVGIGRKEMSDDQFRGHVLKSIDAFAALKPEERERLKDFHERFVYYAADFEKTADYEHLSDFLFDLDQDHETLGNRLYYLATPASAFPVIANHLHHHGLISDASDPNWSRVVFEKPFGVDLPSAKALQLQLERDLDESQIYRIDHYLGKAAVQKILPFRLSHPQIEQRLNNQQVDSIEITLSEELGVGTRANLFEESGLLRDLVQNHVMQLLTLIAMEPPQTLSPADIQAAKVKLLTTIRPFPLDDLDSHIVRGQYGPGEVKSQAVPGYRDEVGNDSDIETFVSATLWIDNNRWNGVPFNLRAGKRLDKSLVEIAVRFKSSETLLLRIQPNPEIALVNEDGKKTTFVTIPKTPEAYEMLLQASMQGDASLFVGIEELYETWLLFTPVLDYWKANPARDFPNYPAGSAGPLTISLLLESQGA